MEVLVVVVLVGKFIRHAPLTFDGFLAFALRITAVFDSGIISLQNFQAPEYALDDDRVVGGGGGCSKLYSQAAVIVYFLTNCPIRISSISLGNKKLKTCGSFIHK